MHAKLDSAGGFGGVRGGNAVERDSGFDGIALFSVQSSRLVGAGT